MRPQSVCTIRKDRKSSILMATVMFAAAFLSLACATGMNKLDLQEPASVARTERVPFVMGSIWSEENSSNMLFVDKKARYVNDIITILIEESSMGENTANTKTARDSSTSVGIDALLGFDNEILEKNSRMGSSIDIGGSSESSHQGEGNTSRGGELNAVITARVVNVMDNGNLVVAGKRQLTVNEEDQYIVISGIVRPDDITASNVVSSRYIADARVIYTGKGIINDKMRPGWLTRVIDWVWPF